MRVIKFINQLKSITAHISPNNYHFQFPGALYYITARGNEKVIHNHYHLLVETQEGNLSQGMRELNGTYTQHFNKKYQRVGHLLQGKYKSILLEKENYLLELSRYISLNPIRAKLVEDHQAWSWSSYPPFVGITRKIPFLATGWILSQF